MFGAHVAVVKIARGCHAELQHLLGARSVGKVGRCSTRCDTSKHILLDEARNLIEVNVEAQEHVCANPFSFANERQQ